MGGFSSRFLPFYLFLLDPVVGNLLNCFLELLLRGDPVQTFLWEEQQTNYWSRAEIEWTYSISLAYITAI